MNLYFKYLRKTLFSIFIFLGILVNLTSQTVGDVVEDAFFQINNQAHAKAFQDEDVSFLLQGVSEDIRLMPEFQSTIISKSNAEAYYEAFFDRFDISSCERRSFEVTDIGMYVVELGHFNMEIQDDKKDYSIQSRYFCIWEKQGGDLIKTIEAWNYSHATDLQDRLRFQEVPSLIPAFAAHVPIADNISFELQALNVLMSNIIIRHDHEVWSQFFSDDAMFVYTANPIYQGRQQLDAFIKRHAVEEIGVFEHLDIRNDTILESGNYVIELASHIANYRSGHYSGINTGKDLRIWRREENGTLKIFRQIAMYD